MSQNLCSYFHKCLSSYFIFGFPRLIFFFLYGYDHFKSFWEINREHVPVVNVLPPSPNPSSLHWFVILELYPETFLLLPAGILLTSVSRGVLEGTQQDEGAFLPGSRIISSFMLFGTQPTWGGGGAAAAVKLTS